ncbi:MAG: LL-diaminopimelate aminotransferase [Firmicutes bacterium]|nr:LL-diaminopimelate aminotransferase [Bacillota bacterium]
MKINTNFENLKENYLFATIAERVAKHKADNPMKNIIRLGIGDVTLPLSRTVVNAMKKAADEMGDKPTFRGYGEYRGYDFLQNAIARYYAKNGVTLVRDEIFVSDGAKSDAGNFLDIFDKSNIVLNPDPVYPVYVDSNIMAGRKIIFTNGNESNGFLPMPCAKTRADIIYICSPNNPTGAVYTRDALRAWVDYANEQNALIIFDSAYEAFISDDNLPRSIFEIDGARTCAVEIGSLSKTAGFTGTRCGYTIVPMELMAGKHSINKLWYRRQATKFNGVSYVIQRGAEAVFTDEGLSECKANIDYYMGNARILCDALTSMGISHTGGTNSPYVWLRCPNGLGSWEFFDKLLNEANLVGTPGAGFGKMGEGYFRLTAFGSREDVIEAVDRLSKLK